MNNIKYHMTQFFDEELSFKWLGVGIALFCYGFFLRKNIFIISISDSKQINMWDFIVNFIGNIYLILYFMTPFLLLASLSVIKIQFGEILLIRLGSYKNWVMLSLVNFLQKAAVFLFILAIVMLLLVMGIPKEQGWSEFTLYHQGILSSYPASIISQYLNSPISALFLQVFQMLLFFVTVHLMLTIFFVITKKKVFSVISAIVLWVLSVILFKWGSSNSVFQFSNYLSFYQGINTFGKSIESFWIIIFFFFLFLFICFKIDLNIKIFISLIEWKIVAYFALFILALLSVFQKDYILSIQDVFITLFYGTSETQFNFLSFISYIIIYYGFVYFVQIFLDNELSSLGYYKVLRYGSITSWLSTCLRQIFLSIFLLLISLFIAVMTGSLFQGLDFNNSFFSNVQLSYLFYHFIVNGFLQTLFYCLLILIIAWVSKEMFYGFVILLLLAIFMFPGLNFYHVIPSGLNSIGYIVDGVSPYFISSILLIYLIIEIIIIYYLITRLDFHSAN